MSLKTRWQNALTWLKAHARQLLFLAALLHGLFYVFAIPPWWHYEEGPHFEYAWGMAHPEEKGAPVPSIRVEIARSMLRSGWAEYINLRPPALEDPESLFIGYQQYGDSPLYYWLASLPLRLLANAPVEAQLYAARLVSLLMLLLAMLLADRTLALLQAPENVHLLALGFLAASPSWMDSMLAVHNDPLGALAAAAYLYATLETIRNPKRAGNWLFLLAASLLAYYGSAPSRFLLASLIFFPLFIFWQQRKTPLWRQALALAGLFLLGGVVFFHTPVPKSWVGRAARPGITLPPKSAVYQIIPPSQTEPLRGQQLTLTATFTAQGPIQKVGRVVLYFRDESYQRTPERYSATIKAPSAGSYTTSLTFSVPENASLLYLVLAAPPDAPIAWERITLQHNGGNIVRNPDGRETAWSFSWPQIENHLPVQYLSPAIIAQQLQDWEGYAWYYRYISGFLSNGFWGRMAGNLIPLPGDAQTYRVLNVLGGIIALLALWQWGMQARKHPSLAGWALFLFLVALGMVLIRGNTAIYAYIMVVPYIRYLLPGFVPLAWLFALGLSRLPLPLGLGALGVWALLGVYAISDFYHPVFTTPARFILAVGLGLGATVLFLLLWKGNAHAD